MRHVAVFMLLSCQAWSQFTDFATTDDGQQVYFTTALAQRGSSTIGPFSETRVYRFDGPALELFAERGDLARPDGGGSGDGASSVQVSGDGQSVAFVLTQICIPEEPCRTTISRAEVRGKNAQILPGDPHRVLMSRNGQWALVVPPPLARGGVPGSPPVQNTESTLVNLVTREARRTGMPATPSSTFVLGSDGSVLARVTEGEPPSVRTRVGIWKDGQLSLLPPLTGGISFLGMSDDAGTLLVSRIELPLPGTPIDPSSLPGPELIAINVRSGTAKTIHRLGNREAYNLLGITNNGEYALLGTISPAGVKPVLLADIRAGRMTTLELSDGETVRSGTISGHGNVAIVATSRGRILRVPVQGSRAVEELLPATPSVSFRQLPAPGALVEFEAPISGDIDWAKRIRLNGLPLAILRRTGNVLSAQIPWEIQTPTTADVSIDYPSTSPLVQQARIFVAPQSPAFPPLADVPQGAILGGHLIRGDFSGYVNKAPNAGDIVHMYMTGLGPVRGSVQTGEPAPLNDLRPTLIDVRCRFLPYESEARTLFAGLAPGLIGIYQLTFQFGPEVRSDVNLTGTRCTVGTGILTFMTAPAMPGGGMP